MHWETGQRHKGKIPKVAHNESTSEIAGQGWRGIAENAKPVPGSGRESAKARRATWGIE